MIGMKEDEGSRLRNSRRRGREADLSTGSRRKNDEVKTRGVQLSGSGTPGRVGSGPGSGCLGGGAWKERHTQKLDRDSCKTRNLGQDKSRQDNVPSTVSHSSALALR